MNKISGATRPSINYGNADKVRRKKATFPAQALSCSGSTGIISAYPKGISTPGTWKQPGNRLFHLQIYSNIIPGSCGA